MLPVVRGMNATFHQYVVFILKPAYIFSLKMYALFKSFLFPYISEEEYNGHPPLENTFIGWVGKIIPIRIFFITQPDRRSYLHYFYW